MSGVRGLFLSCVVASAFAVAVFGCGGGHSNSGFVPTNQNGNIQVTSFTVQPTTITGAPVASFTYSLNNPGTASSSNIQLQTFISTQMITLQNYTSSSVTALGSPMTVSAVAGGQQSSGTLAATISTPGITRPASAFIALVAIPQSSSSQPAISQNIAVSLQ